MSAKKAYEALVGYWQELGMLGSAGSVLSWDQEVMMPSGAAEYRAKQLSVLSGLVHERVVDEHVGEWLSECEYDEALMGDGLNDAAVNVRGIRRDYENARKLPTGLVKELAEVTSLAQVRWAKARQAKDYSMFEGELGKVVELLREKAKCMGWDDDGEAWDGLADEYEEGCKARDVVKVFEPLRDGLVELLGRIKGSVYEPSGKLNEMKIAEQTQFAFVKEVAGKMGFEWSNGRLDKSAHPFCTTLGVGDVRLTTRFHEDMVGDALGSTMHEAGHGLYEQGMRRDMGRLPLGESVSLGIHESQSRLWENLVGRSEAFWGWSLDVLRKYAEGAGELSVRECYEGVNNVEAGLIRVEADEVTYNLHVMIRFELERAMIAGDLEVKDLPGAWNEKYREYLGVEVPDDGVGCMQDVHWSLGAMGYFPTYTLGTMYASQFFEAANREIDGLAEMFGKGEFGELREWLRGKIHEQGRRYRADELCEIVTGEKLSAEPLMRHLEGKFGEVYRL